MAGRGYTIFDTAIGRCGIAWGDDGVVGVQLPEAREIETRRRMLRQYPDARDIAPPLNVEIAVDAMVALLRGQPCDFSDVTLDLNGVPPFNRRVYEFARAIPRGETLTYAEFARRLGASGAAHAVGQAIGRNPFTIIVPCHRVLAGAGEADGSCMNGGVISKRRLLSLEGALAKSGPTLFDVLLSVAPPRLQS
jgi:methylated-DNA-[protein]-cysteine S-methyltransferase